MDDSSEFGLWKYRHASVVLSAGERQVMEAAREGRPAMGPHRQERSREQVEIG